MNIYEQPIDKLQQCIENENRRLNDIDDTLYKLHQKYEASRIEFIKKLSAIEDKMNKLEAAYEGAKKFIDDCQNQINKLQNQ